MKKKNGFFLDLMIELQIGLDLTKPFVKASPSPTLS
jgi:hypothetical protein